MAHDFKEKTTEWHKEYGEIPVIKTAKYQESKEKAIELIDAKKFGLQDGDFWILMNATKAKKMMYTGLIISHNGCLKINGTLAEKDKFKPECMSLDKDGYNNSLVYTYCSPDQGIFEVGEVSSANCKNPYPYAMALKRCMDRVILKLSKVSMHGIVSESESDEFRGLNDVAADETNKTSQNGAQAKAGASGQLPNSGKIVLNARKKAEVKISEILQNYIDKIISVGGPDYTNTVIKGIEKNREENDILKWLQEEFDKAEKGGANDTETDSAVG